MILIKDRATKRAAMKLAIRRLDKATKIVPMRKTAKVKQASRKRAEHKLPTKQVKMEATSNPAMGATSPVKVINPAKARAKAKVRGKAKDRAKVKVRGKVKDRAKVCLLYTSPSPRDRTRSRMPSSA